MNDQKKLGNWISLTHYQIIVIKCLGMSALNAFFLCLFVACFFLIAMLIKVFLKVVKNIFLTRYRIYNLNSTHKLES